MWVENRDVVSINQEEAFKKETLTFAPTWVQEVNTEIKRNLNDWNQKIDQAYQVSFWDEWAETLILPWSKAKIMEQINQLVRELNAQIQAEISKVWENEQRLAYNVSQIFEKRDIALTMHPSEEQVAQNQNTPTPLQDGRAHEGQQPWLWNTIDAIRERNKQLAWL